ncbi:hypothetical protein Tco_0077757 [Tanacetum coccineum]
MTLSFKNLCGSNNPKECNGKEAFEILEACHVDPPGDTMEPTLPPRRFLMPVFIGPPFIRMPTNLSKLVMLVKNKAKSLNVMRCLKMQSKFVRFSIYGVSILWDRFRHRKGTNISRSCRLSFQVGFDAKAAPYILYDAKG